MGHRAKKILVLGIMVFAVTGCTAPEPPAAHATPTKQATTMTIANAAIKNHPFLEGMDRDDYYPKHLVAAGKQTLLRLCEAIEKQQPANEEALYILTHAATEEFNELAEAFVAADSEIETVAREYIAAEFEFIAKAYGFESADVEELIATRDW